MNREDLLRSLGSTVYPSAFHCRNRTVFILILLDQIDTLNYPSLRSYLRQALEYRYSIMSQITKLSKSVALLSQFFNSIPSNPHSDQHDGMGLLLSLRKESKSLNEIKQTANKLFEKRLAIDPVSGNPRYGPLHISKIESLFEELSHIQLLCDSLLTVYDNFYSSQVDCQNVMEVSSLAVDISERQPTVFDLAQQQRQIDMEQTLTEKKTREAAEAALVWQDLYIHSILDIIDNILLFDLFCQHELAETTRMNRLASEQAEAQRLAETLEELRKDLNRINEKPRGLVSLPTAIFYLVSEPILFEVIMVFICLLH